MEHAVIGQREAVMDQALAIEPLADAGFVQEIDHALLEHAGADARQDVVGAAPFDNDVVDAGARQQLPEQQPGRPGADDGDLRSHCR
ncbi:hypothetical protein BTHI11S_05895 [Bosea thiooxidans]